MEVGDGWDSEIRGQSAFAYFPTVSIWTGLGWSWLCKLTRKRTRKWTRKWTLNPTPEVGRIGEVSFSSPSSDPSFLSFFLLFSCIKFLSFFRSFFSKSAIVNSISAFLLCLCAGGRHGGSNCICVADTRWRDGKMSRMDGERQKEGKREDGQESETRTDRQTEGEKKVGEKMLMTLLYCWRFNSIEWRHRRCRPAEYKTATLHVNLIGPLCVCVCVLLSCCCSTLVLHVLLSVPYRKETWF